MERNEEYDKLIDDDGVVNETVPVVVETKKEKESGQTAIAELNARVLSFAKAEGRKLTDAEMGVLSSNHGEFLKKMNDSEGKYNSGNIRITECGFYQQLLSMAKLQMSIKDQECFLDIRSNRNAKGKYDINIKLQYQGEFKLLENHATIDGHKLNNFDAHVIWEKDIFKKKYVKGGWEVSEYEPFDFKHGMKKEESKKYKLDYNNIVAAFATCSYDNGMRDKEYFAFADFDRIEKARDHATGLNYANGGVNLKSPWNAHPGAMAEKTAKHLLYAKMRPFIHFSNEIKKDLEAVETSNTQETKYSNSIDVETNVQENAGTVELGSEFSGN